MTDRGARALFAGILRLVPYSGIQCCDIRIATEATAAVSHRFIEEIYEADGASHRILLPLDARPIVSAAPGAAASAIAASATRTPRSLHPVNGRPLDPSRILEITGPQALAHFAGRWLPLPYLRFVGRDEQQRPRYDAGPSNWARAWITLPLDEAEPHVRITLAFDTSLDRQSRFDSAAYLAPNGDDAAFGSTFICAESVDELGGFLGEPWLEAWLGNTTVGTAGESDTASEFQHRPVALYLTLLRLLVSAGVMPETRFIDTIQRRFPIRTAAVDLILDLGDTETTALLVDGALGVGGQSAEGFAEHLRLRDLTAPHEIHEGPFPTHAEFNAPPFGDAVLSRDSGRHDAFSWPSLVRIGHEARRLSLRNNGTEGVTGLSNLRSFLLDDAPSPGLWRQSTEDQTAVEHGPMVSGMMLMHVGENGTVLGTEPPDPSRALNGPTKPAIRPRFSRASMIGFFATELVLHALAQVNAATPDGIGGGDNQVRELRQIVVLAPPALSEREREALRARVDAGIVLAWRGLGWERGVVGAPQRPSVVLGLGGDLGVQVAFLHDEVTHKYQGRFRDLLQVYHGDDRHGPDTLRVASVEFSSRATSLAIVDYTASEHPLGSESWSPSIKVSERLPVGTDAAAQALIWSMVLPAIESALEAAGLVPARHFLDEITGRSTTSLLVEDPYFTRRLNRKVLWPASRGLLALDEHGASSTHAGNRSIALGTLVELGGGRLDGIANVFETAALQAGAQNFHLADTEIALPRGAVGRLIADEMHDTVAQVSRVVTAHACDVLLLAGDGTRLPAMRRAVLAALPIAASRIIDLNSTLNRSTAQAIGSVALLAPATVMPAIAAALERRNSLAVSGLGADALRLLAAPSSVVSDTSGGTIGPTSSASGDIGSRVLIAHNGGAVPLRPAAGAGLIAAGLVPGRGA
jgi:hypothetical protein